MLQGLISGVSLVLMFYIGKGLVALGYGKKGMYARYSQGKSSNGLAVLLGVLFFLWLFFGVFFYYLWKETASLVIMIVCPVIYGVWFFYARKSSKKLIEESKALAPEEDNEDNPDNDGPPQVGEGWRCLCGRVHQGYESSCVCGKTKSECK